MTDYCCKKPKNPCMVCQRTVTNKTGLQCQGSCKAWIHYTCCSYTPGKIKDIKAKIIKVRCPCPDCTPQVPKEELVQEDTFSCVNSKCPVKPKCVNQQCPEHKMSQMPSSFTPSMDWPGVPCGTPCKQNSESPPRSSVNMREANMGDRRSSPPCRSPPPCKSPPPPCRQPPPCSPPPCSPPPCPQEPVMPSISVVENMCETVGVLSDQLNQLMSKMTHVLNPGGKSGGSSGNACYCPQNPKRC